MSTFQIQVVRVPDASMGTPMDASMENVEKIHIYPQTFNNEDEIMRRRHFRLGCFLIVLVCLFAVAIAIGVAIGLSLSINS